MKRLAFALTAAGLIAGCTPAVDEDVINQMENAVREGLASRGTVKQVELNRESEHRMTGFAVVEPQGGGAEQRYNCTAEREGESGAQFNWRCQPADQQQAAASSSGGDQPSDGGKDPQAAPAAAGGGGAGPGRMALVGRWTDNGDCSVVTLLGEDGVFIAPNGARGNWAINGEVLSLSGPGGQASWTVFLQDPNTLVLTDPQGGQSTSTRC